MLSVIFFKDPLILFLTGLGLLILFFWYFATEIERKKRNIGTGLILGIVTLCLLAIFPLKERLKGGIDIIGGSAFSLRIQPKEDDDGNKLAVTPEQVDEAMRVIEDRLNARGTAEPLIARQGEDGVIVQMPGIEPEESEQVEIALETVAKLQLLKVSPRTNEIGGADRNSLAERVRDGLELLPGSILKELTQEDEVGNITTTPLLLERRGGLGGADIARANPSPGRSDTIDITLNGPGTDKMINLTKDMRPNIDRIAIVLDGKVLSAPVVVSTPLGKQFVINGLTEKGEPKELSNALMNPLENPLIVEQKSIVSPTLGQAFVKQGISAAAAGILVTAIFIFHLLPHCWCRRPRCADYQCYRPLRSDGNVRLHLLTSRNSRADSDDWHGCRCERAYLRAAS